MSRFAEGTDVPADRSRAEIERTLERYGASGMFYHAEADRASIGFKMHNRIVRFDMPMPPLADFRKVSVNRHGSRDRTPAEQAQARSKIVRQRWRCLALAVKAKLEVVESGVATFEQEFLAHIVLAHNRTVYQEIAPRLEEAYTTGKPIQLLPSAK